MDTEIYNDFNIAIDRLVEEILNLPNLYGSKSRKVKGPRLLSLRTSVEILVRDTVAIRFNRSRRNYVSIRKGKDVYTQNKYNKRLSYRFHLKRAYESMIYLREVKKGTLVFSSPVTWSRINFSTC